MRKFSFSILLLTLLLSFAANAKSSFRLESGKNLRLGQSKFEVIALAGVPLYQDVERLAVDIGQGANPVKREILMYKVKGSIGGLYLVALTIENNKVVSISSKQEDRI